MITATKWLSAVRNVDGVRRCGGGAGLPWVWGFPWVWVWGLKFNPHGSPGEGSAYSVLYTPLY